MAICKRKKTNRNRVFMQVLPDSNSIFLSHVLKRVRHRLMTHPPQSFMRNCLVAGAVAFIRGVASVSKNTSSKMLLNQSELLFLRANNIIKTSNFILLVLPVPCGPVGISVCYLLMFFICYFFDCLRLELRCSFELLHLLASAFTLMLSNLRASG